MKGQCSRCGGFGDAGAQCPNPNCARDATERFRFPPIPRFRHVVHSSHEWQTKREHTPEGNVILLPHVHVVRIEVQRVYAGYTVAIEAYVQSSNGEGRIPLQFSHAHPIGREHSAAAEANAIAEALHELWAHEMAECIRRASGAPYVEPHPGPNRSDGWHQGEEVDR